MSAFDWLNFGKSILQAIPVAIMAVESMKVTWKDSREKQDSAVEIVKHVSDTVEVMTPAIEQSVRTIIDASVALMNKQTLESKGESVKQ